MYYGNQELYSGLSFFIGKEIFCPVLDELYTAVTNSKDLRALSKVTSSLSIPSSLLAICSNNPAYQGLGVFMLLIKSSICFCELGSLAKNFQSSSAGL